MSDPADTTGVPASPVEVDSDPHADRLSEILADPSLPDRDKRRAIQEALDDMQRERGEELAASYEPLETRFFEALELLAAGGHDYDEAAPSDAGSPTTARNDND